jgi:Iron-containing redox enzyme
LTRSRRVRRQLAAAVGPLTEACTALVEHPRLQEVWPEYLVLQHQIIRATVPLTRAALERTRELKDELREPLAEYLEEHVDEELDHDEGLLDDLELLGLGRESVVDRMPPPTVAALVGAQYYWIHHHHPVAFLGYVALMEGYPPTPGLIETLAARTGYPSESFRTFTQHADLDPGHRDHLDETLDALPLDERNEGVIVASARTTAVLAAKAISEIL